MGEIKELILPELLVLVPVLYLIGMGMKKSSFVPDNFIPTALGICGVILSAIHIFATGADSVSAGLFAALTQGILCAGASVYANQLVRQSRGDKK